MISPILSTASSIFTEPPVKSPTQLAHGAWFTKKSGTALGTAKLRFFVLEGNKLAYHNDSGEKQGHIDLDKTQVITGEGKVLLISSPLRTFHLTADTETQVKEWVASLCELQHSLSM